MYDVNDAVTAGAALLDTEAPGWQDKVDLDHLDMESTSACILGQVFYTEEDWYSGWGRGMRLLFGDTGPEYSVPNGFEGQQGEDGERNYEDLNHAWVAFLSK